MTCKLNLIEVVVLTALLAIMIGFAVGVIESMITTSHFPPWLAVPAGMAVALVVVGGPVALFSLLVRRLRRRSDRRLKAKAREDGRNSAE